MKIYFTIMCILCACAPKHIYAETIVGGLYSKPVVWTKAGSPYVVKTSTTFLNADLRIDSGVEVRFEKSIFFKNSSLSVLGTELKPTVFTANNMSSSLISGDNYRAYVQHVKLIGKNNSSFMSGWNKSDISIDNLYTDSFGAGRFINVWKESKLMIKHTKLKNWKGKGIELFSSSTVDVRDSDFINTDMGIYGFDNTTVNIQDSLFEANNKAILVQTSNLSVHKTDFNQNQYAIVQDVDTESFRPLDATDNWFGTSTQPDLQPLNKMLGNIHFTPWSKTKNRKDLTICCSNVLFFPGLMGSRLYQKNSRYENQLWEPNRNADVKKLFMNKYGEAVEPGIYTRDILSKTNIFGGVLLDKSIYKDFVSDMNSLVSKKVIRHFDSVPYDWRFAPDTLLQEGVLLSNGTSTFTRYILDSIYQSAKDSKTGKVTLVTHSNGGLIVRYLLAYAKKHDIYLPIDKVVYVGIPEHGTPQAVTSLLFGHEQSVAGGLILKSSVAKDLGKNMPTAYMLLPQKTYFDYVGDMAVGASAVHTVEEFNQVLRTGSTVFNHDLFEKAKAIHSYIQSEQIQSVQQFQIVGVGVPTVSGFIEHTKRAIPLYDNMGDGVVERGGGRTGITTEVDLSDTGYTHADMMNEGSIRQHIYNILSDNIPTASSGLDIKAETYSRLIIEDLEPLAEPIELRILPTKGKPITYKNISSSFIESKGEVGLKTFDKGLEYIELNDNDNSSKHISVQIQSRAISTTTVAHITNSPTTGNIQVQTYEHIPLYMPAIITMQNNHAVLSIPDLHIEEYITPTSVIDITKNGSIEISQATTTTQTFEEKLQITKQRLASSTTGFYLKTRYIKYLDQLEKRTIDEQKKQLTLLIEKIKRSIKNIDRYSNNPNLKARYASTRADYAYLLFVLGGVIAK